MIDIGVNPLYWKIRRSGNNIGLYQPYSRALEDRMPIQYVSSQRWSND